MRIPLLCLMLCLTTPLWAEVIPVVAFDQAPVGAAPEGWKLRGTNGYASKMSVAECDLPGQKRRCLEIDYDFQATRNPGGLDPGTKTVVLGTWARLPENTRRLRLMIGGDGSGHGLIVGVGETGKWFNFPAGAVAVPGWQTVEVDLADPYRDHGGPNANGRLDPPLHLVSLNLLQKADAPAQGTIRLLSVEAITQPPAPVDDLRIVPWGSAVTGLVPVAGVDQATLSLASPAAVDVTGTVSWKITSPYGYVAEHAEPCTIAAGTLTRTPLVGLPPRCSYYDLTVTFTAGEARKVKELSLAVVPPVMARDRVRYRLGVLGAAPNLGYRWIPVLRQLGADGAAIQFDPGAAGTEQAANEQELVGAATAAGLHLTGCLKPGGGGLDEALHTVPALQALAGRYSGNIGLWSCPWLDAPEHTAQLARVLAADLKQRLGRPALALGLEAGAFEVWRNASDLLTDVCTLFCDTLEANLSDLAEWTPARVAEGVHQCYPGKPIAWGGVINRDRGFPSNAQPTVLERRMRDARGLAITLLDWSAAAAPEDSIAWPIVNTPLANWPGNESRLFSEWSHPLPAAAAYATITMLLRDATSATRTAREGLVTLIFDTPQGQVLAAWNEQGQTATLRLKAIDPCRRLDMLGGADELTPGDHELPVGPQPVYVQGRCDVLPPR